MNLNQGLGAGHFLGSHRNGISGTVKYTKKKLLKTFIKFFLNLFLERRKGKEEEREGNTNVWLPVTCPLLGTWPETQACALTGN